MVFTLFSAIKTAWSVKFISDPLADFAMGANR